MYTADVRTVYLSFKYATAVAATINLNECHNHSMDDSYRIKFIQCNVIHAVEVLHKHNGGKGKMQLKAII